MFSRLTSFATGTSLAPSDELRKIDDKVALGISWVACVYVSYASLHLRTWLLDLLPHDANCGFVFFLVCPGFGIVFLDIPSRISVSECLWCVGLCGIVFDGL